MKHEGYLLVDHRNSPGLTEEQARAAGYDPLQVKGGKIYEAASLSCAHCKTAIIKNPFRTRARESCPKCCDVTGAARYICDFCYADTFRADYVHVPWEKKVDDNMKAVIRETMGSPSKLLMPG